MAEQPSFGVRVTAVLKGIAVKLFAPGVALLVIVGAILLASLGFKELRIGGLLAKLLGHKDPENKAIDVANSVAPDRVDAQGKPIPEGQPDSKGDTQAIVVPIKDPGLFSNPDTVKFVPPGADKAVEVKLPDGVKAHDVEKVVVIKPEVYAVQVKDSSGIPGKKIDDLLKRYG